MTGLLKPFPYLTCCDRHKRMEVLASIHRKQEREDVQVHLLKMLSHL